MALSAQSQLAFSEQLLTLLNAGLPLLNAVQLIQSSANTDSQPWLQEIQIQLKKGNSFSQSLASQRNLFSVELINLIRVSERTGDMQLALKIINQQLESQIQLKQKIRQALTYPITTLASSFLLLIVMMLWVIPVFKEVFENFQADLPMPTRVLIQISTIIQSHFFDFETLHLLHISSESGLLANMLSKRANSLSDQLSKQLNNLGQTLEPLLIILIGIIIGGLVIVLYLPIFHLGQIV